MPKNKWQIMLESQSVPSVPEIDVFTPATDTENGSAGLVPAPLVGNDNSYLKADGTWSEIDVPDGLEEALEEVEELKQNARVITQNSDLHIYISKDGSDDNNGLTIDTPVATFEKAIEISCKIKPVSPTGVYYLHFGPGNWGSISLHGLSGHYDIRTFSNDSVSAYSDQLPVFDTINVREAILNVNGTVSRSFGIGDGGILYLDTYNRTGLISSWGGQLVYASGLLEFYNTGNTNSFIRGDNTVISFGTTTIRLIEDLPLTYGTIVLSNRSHCKGLANLTIDFNGHTIANAGGKRFQFITGSYADIEESAIASRFPDFTTNFSTALIDFSRACTLDTDQTISGAKTFTNTISGSINGNAATATKATQDGAGNVIVNKYVNVDGDQTITGEKTFTKDITIQRGGGTLLIHHPSAARAGTTDIQGNIKLTDKDGLTVSRLLSHMYATGNHSLLQLKGYAPGANEVSSGINLSIYSSKKFDLYCDGDNAVGLGMTTNRFKQLFAGTATISTSDEREKQQIEAIPDAVLDAWAEVGFLRFKFNDAVEEKGDKARAHTGLVAQRIKEIFEARGIDPSAYGFFCHDVWDARPETRDADGEIIEKAQEAGDHYALRYEECFAIEAAYQRRRADRLEEKLNQLETQINLIRQNLNL